MISVRKARDCELVLRHLLYGDTTPFAEDTDWKTLREIVEVRRVECLVDCSADPALAPLRRPEKAFGHVLCRRTQRETVKRLFQEMKERGLRAALLKGMELERCYPAGTVRTSGDIDLFVPNKQRQAFMRMMAELGIPLISDIRSGQTGVDTYQTAAGAKLEVHFIIFYRLGAFQRKRLRELGFFSDRFFVPGGDEEIAYETFCPQAHLFYLLYHTIQHMLHQTLRLQMLADLTAYVNRHADSLDASALRDLLRELTLLRPANALLCYCARHLGMRQDFWPVSGPAMEFFLRFMMKSEHPRHWERFFDRNMWAFYPIECIEKDGEYYLRYTYHPLRALKSKYNLSTFCVWWLVRLVWGIRVDTSGETA